VRSIRDQRQISGFFYRPRQTPLVKSAKTGFFPGVYLGRRTQKTLDDFHVLIVYHVAVGGTEKTLFKIRHV